MNNEYVCFPGGEAFDSLDAARAFADASVQLGTEVRGADGTLLYAPAGEFPALLLRTGKEICDYVRDNQFNYGDAPVNPAVNHDAKLVSCDRFVAWVLYRLGYTDQPTSHGLCVSGPQLTNWCIDHGFERLDRVSDLRPGDIAFTRRNAVDCPGHTFLFAGASDTPGLYYRYDCGRVERIRSTQPSCEPLTDEEFMYGYRPVPVHDFIRPGLSFVYDGVPFAALDKQVETLPDGVRYTLPDGLRVSCLVVKYPAQRVYKWVTRWENPTNHASGLVTDLWDCDVTLPFAPDEPVTRRNRQDTMEPHSFRVFETKGANVTPDDYSASASCLFAGQSRTYGCQAGRSGYGTAPFFDLNRGDCGALLAVGWTGQWKVIIDRMMDSVRVRSGIEQAQRGFRLRPGETFRTSSAAMMLYFRGQDEAHNRFRSFMREISPIGPGSPRGEQCPFSAIFWGGIPSRTLMNRWTRLYEESFPFDTCWIDAGWYEPLRSETTDAQLAEWPRVGRWEVNRFYHPDGYRELSDFLHAHGTVLMLWFEPERFRRSISAWTEALPSPAPERDDCLIALNEDSVCDAVIEMVSEKIRTLSLSVYRQDCNIAPLDYWAEGDKRDGMGTTEIRYINNLYRFWDTLLARFPALLIDNCAGGGHRNDIEMLSRAVPLWRSDYQCTWDCMPEANQMQNQAAAWWIPYAGIGYGPTLGDTYSFRSAYCSGMTVRTWEHADPEWEVGASGEPMEWARRYFAEYSAVRKYFSADYYPLIPFSRENGTWCASEYYDPEQYSGVILAFRRAACPYDEVTVRLSGLHPHRRYTLTDADTGASFTASGYELTSKGLRLRLDEPRKSLLMYIR